MSKFSAFVYAPILLLPSGNPAGVQFEKYKKIEAYEIRPGILMMPTYSADGQICEIGLEVRHYSPEKVILDSDLTREEINQIFDELAPVNERGARSQNFGRDLISETGTAITTSIVYENVLLQIYGERLSGSKREVVESDVVATLRWKNRKCE